MPEEMSLEMERLYERAADNFDRIINDIQTVLRNNSNRFVSIREIAERLNWPSEGYNELKVICLVATCSSEYERDREELEYKYNPDREVGERRMEYERNLDRICRELRELIIMKLRQPSRRRRHEEQDRQLQSAEDQLRRTRRQEEEQRRHRWDL